MHLLRFIYTENVEISCICADLRIRFRKKFSSYYDYRSEQSLLSALSMNFSKLRNLQEWWANQSHPQTCYVNSHAF